MSPEHFGIQGKDPSKSIEIEAETDAVKDLLFGLLNPEPRSRKREVPMRIPASRSLHPRGCLI
jgi:hypothetical protein